MALLLAIEDISERRAVERELAHLMRQKELLLEEMRHRIANSLQIIASILLLKARSVQSDETRGHLQDAHKRVLSVAAVQQHLQASGHGERIALGPYLSKLCETLAASIIGETRTVSLESKVGGGMVVSSEAVSIGLIVIESVINALKHAFPQSKTGWRGSSSPTTATAMEWMLSIADNGVGKSAKGAVRREGGSGDEYRPGACQRARRQRRNRQWAPRHHCFCSAREQSVPTSPSGAHISHGPGVLARKLSKASTSAVTHNGLGFTTVSAHPWLSSGSSSSWTKVGGSS